MASNFKDLSNSWNLWAKQHLFLLFRMGKEMRTCLHGYKAKNHTNISIGCEPIFHLNGHQETYDSSIPHLEFYGYYSTYVETNNTLKDCKEACLDDSNCKALQVLTSEDGIRTSICFQL